MKKQRNSNRYIRVSVRGQDALKPREMNLRWGHKEAQGVC